MNFIMLVGNEARLSFTEMRQYWFETIASLCVMSGMFVGLFYGVQSVTTNSAQSLDGLVFGFLLWIFATIAYSSVTKCLVEDNQKGFLEQLFLCPAGFTQLMIARTVVELMVGMITVTLMMSTVMQLTNNWIDLNLGYLYLLLIVASVSLIGLGFIVSGLALVFKKVATIGALFNIGFIGLVAVDALPLNLFSLLPFTAGASLARHVILEGAPFNWLDFSVVVVNSCCYLVVGLITFSRLERYAKRQNLIGQY